MSTRESMFIIGCLFATLLLAYIEIPSVQRLFSRLAGSRMGLFASMLALSAVTLLGRLILSLFLA